MTKAALLTNIILKLTITISVITALFFFIPIKIELPKFLYEFLVDSPLQQVFLAIDYLLPIDFILGCFLFIFLLRNIGIIFGAIKWAFNLIK